MVIGQLRCPKCKTKLDEIEILNNSTVSWPTKGWILFKCSNCDGQSHVELSNGEIAIGFIDGAPGPCLIRTSMKENNMLIVEYTNQYIQCQFGSNSFVFLRKPK